MGLHNRPYWRDDESPMTGSRGGISFGLPRPGLAVKGLLIANIAVYLLQVFLDRHGRMSSLLGATVHDAWQVWRYVTFQFLHSPNDPWHILLNMLGVYMLGTPLEALWGWRRFLRFYLICGIVAGVAYVVIGALGGVPHGMPIIGASGGVYAIVLACAVFFPHFQIILLFFPVPIRLAAIIIFAVMIFTVVSSLAVNNADRAMSDVAHLGGAVAAAVWIWVVPAAIGAKHQATRRLNQGAWQRKMRRQAEEGAEIDRILQKIHDEGVGSLTGREKQMLQDATRRQQEEEQQARRQ